MRDCLYKSVVQQLLQTLLVVLIDIYFEVMRTLVALVVTILYILYSVAYVPGSSYGVLFIETLSKKV